MRPLFSLVTFLLVSGAVLLLLAIGIVFTSHETPPPGCAVVAPPEIKCGVALEQLNFKESMDSVEYSKYLRGSNLYKEAGCPSCHDLDRKKVGPRLGGILKRRDTTWVRKAIINFDTLLVEEDPEAMALSEEYGHMRMPNHDFLNKDEVEKIILYINKGR